MEVDSCGGSLPSQVVSLASRAAKAGQGNKAIHRQ